MAEPNVVAQIIVNQLDSGQVQVTWSPYQHGDGQILGMLEMAKVVFMRAVILKRDMEGGEQ